MELGLTAAAIPVELDCRPSKLSFGSCAVGDALLQSLLLVNSSDYLPLNFQCRLPAHFKMSATKGLVNPGESLELDVAFQPRQLGPLSGSLLISVTAPTREGRETIHTVSVDLLAAGANSPAAKKRMKRKTALAKLDDMSQSIRPHDRTLDVRYAIAIPSNSRWFLSDGGKECEILVH